MRLTNCIRDAFVRAVMDDVPNIKYDDQIRALIASECASIKKKLKIDHVPVERLANNYVYVGGQSHSTRGLIDEETITIKNLPAVTDLVNKQTAQVNTRNALHSKLKGAIYACNTRKQAVEALPEFEKYLPADEEKAMRSLPAIANVLGDFVRAGWPKEQKRITI